MTSLAGFDHFGGKNNGGERERGDLMFGETFANKYQRQTTFNETINGSEEDEDDDEDDEEEENNNNDDDDDDDSLLLHEIVMLDFVKGRKLRSKTRETKRNQKTEQANDDHETNFDKEIVDSSSLPTKKTFVVGKLSFKNSKNKINTKPSRRSKNKPLTTFVESNSTEDEDEDVRSNQCWVTPSPSTTRPSEILNLKKDNIISHSKDDDGDNTITDYSTETEYSSLDLEMNLPKKEQSSSLMNDTTGRSQRASSVMEFLTPRGNDMGINTPRTGSWEKLRSSVDANNNTKHNSQQKSRIGIMAAQKSEEEEEVTTAQKLGPGIMAYTPMSNGSNTTRMKTPPKDDETEDEQEERGAGEKYLEFLRSLPLAGKFRFVKGMEHRPESSQFSNANSNKKRRRTEKKPSLENRPGTKKTSRCNVTGTIFDYNNNNNNNNNNSDHKPTEASSSPPSVVENDKINGQFFQAGKDINGYKLIAKGPAKSATPLANVSNVQKSPAKAVDGYTFSYQLKNEFFAKLKSSQKDPLNEIPLPKDNDGEIPQQTYKEYLKSWSLVGSIKNVIWPCAGNLYDSVTSDSLITFFREGAKVVLQDCYSLSNSGSGGGGGDSLEPCSRMLQGATRSDLLLQNKVYFNVVKNERIRWHPDKMVRMLQSLGVLEMENDPNDPNEKILVEQITAVFQIINGLYEINEKIVE